jgi:hypothetical protein
MATDDPIRASDVDRDTVVNALRDAYAAGRLTLDEFDERMAAAYASKTWGDLRLLTIDLPSQPILGADVPGRRLPAAGALPSHAPRPAPAPAAVPEPAEEPQPPQVRRRGGPIGILIPVAIWMLLVAHGTVGPGIVFVIIAVFALTTIVSTIRRR